jgi:murein tripeptide amidase MpaA
MSELRFDTYYRYDELARVLRELAQAHPGLVRLDSIGRSFEGRDIWLATVTRFATGDDGDKPALWVDGNIHATEVAGSMACLYLLHRLVTGYGADADITRCLDSRVFYICPRLNPDGAELALADVPQLIRSSTRPYPHDEEPIGGLQRQDVDGDGRVLTMRVPDTNGPWKVSDRDPRLLIRRDPAETGGQYFRLLPEGLIEDFDGVTLKLQPRKQQLDLNRNFPAGWRQEHEQYGAGPFPASEPEVHAAVRFITSHSNITGGVAFHTYSGVLLRPYSHRADDTLPAEDLWTYQKIGAKGTELTGYPNISVFHEFRYHPKEVITGSLDDWMYEHGGVFAWTVEIWSPQRPGRHRPLQVHRVVPRASGGGRSQAAGLERPGAGREGLRAVVSGRASAARPGRAGRLGHPVHLEQPAARAAPGGGGAVSSMARLAAADLAEAGADRSDRDPHRGRRVACAPAGA